MRKARLRGSRAPTTSRPTRAGVSNAVQSLIRDGHVVLVDAAVEDQYVQVWFRPDGLYQLEHRDGSPQRHDRVLTVSVDKVERVVLGWLDQADDWDAGVDWTDVSHEFSDDT